MILSKIFCFPDDKFNKRVANFLKKKFSESKNIVITAGKTVKPIYKILDKYKFFMIVHFSFLDQALHTKHQQSNS